MRPTLALLLAASLAVVGCNRSDDAARADDSAAAGGDAEALVGATGFYGTEVPTPRPTPRVRLAEAGGRVFDLAEARGTVVLFFLGFTHCPDVCPLTLARFAQARRALGADTARVRFVFVTVDPERDTPEVAKAYANRFDSTIVALSGPRATIDSVQAAFRATSYREAGVGGQGAGGHAGHGAAGGGAGDTGRARGATSTSAADSVYTVVHPARVYVVDTSGQWRLILPAQATAETMLADVRRLLREAR